MGAQSTRPELGVKRNVRFCFVIFVTGEVYYGMDLRNERRGIKIMK